MHRTGGMSRLLPVGLATASIFTTTKLVALSQKINQLTNESAKLDETIKQLKDQLEGRKNAAVFRFGA
jgi:cell division protein FtsB